MSLHHSTIQRLAFSKYLYSLAVEQSRAPELLAAASLLTFHDSIEMFLQIASEHLDVGRQQPAFLDYWDLFRPKLKSAELPQKESMRRLNKARVSLKHAGTLPSKLDVEAFRASATQFFQEATPLIFDVAFDEISLIEYVSPEQAREHLHKAEELCSQEQYKEATAEIALAFDVMIDSYIEDAHKPWARDAFFFGSSHRLRSAFSLGLRGNGTRDIAEFVDSVKDSLQPMQQAMTILALGLDYKKYSQFISLLPIVTTFIGGRRALQWPPRMDQAPDPTLDYVRFCINYVIECAVRLSESKAESI